MKNRTLLYAISAGARRRSQRFGGKAVLHLVRFEGMKFTAFRPSPS
jgi:hypothetical protein